MRCLVTAGPTWEPLDRVRRLTNFSTGRLGGTLANTLVLAGHDVELFLAETATWDCALAAVTVRRFSTTISLSAALLAIATPEPVAVFHAAAVSDFTGGAAFRRATEGSLVPIQAGKFATHDGTLLLELRPTPKILPQLRSWFPAGRLIGWKYEVDGDRSQALSRAAEQIGMARSDACVVNGPAYGLGFGVLRPDGRLTECASLAELFQRLLELL